MSLDLSLYDDDALGALAPKGVVRRARNDFEAGLASVMKHEAKAATVKADGETVEIDARGPKAAQCTCPAPGLCRHILLAVMALNAGAASDAETEEIAGPSASEEIYALTQAEIESFAGADWAGAVALAASSPESVVEETGRNCRVEIEGSPASVTFLAGLGFKGAAFKGPKTRARLIVAAAALIVRSKKGLTADVTARDDDAPVGTITREYLDDGARKLEQCARMVLAGAAPIAADTLFDLAISARAEAAPRLTSQLRALTKQAGLAAGRMIQFEPEAFLAEAARTYALIEALKQNPSDPALTGVVRRDYEPAPAMDLWVLGAVKWTTSGGSRGLTLHGFAPGESRWHSVTLARGAGADPTFDPRVAFTMPLWASSPAKALVGKIVHLPKPMIANDSAIAPTLPAPPSSIEAIPKTRVLMDAGVAATVWAQLRGDALARMGAGLHRRTTPLPLLIAPTKFGTLSFDDFTQNYELEALDAFGDAIRLILSGDLQAEARRLSEMGRPPLLLAETSGDLDRPALRPVAVLSDSAPGIEVINLTLDAWPHTRSAIETLQSILPRKAAASRLSRDPLADLARRALADATTVCSGQPAPNLAQLERQCDAGGLALIASSLRKLNASPSTATAMATAYLASETLAVLSWT